MDAYKNLKVEMAGETDITVDLNDKAAKLVSDSTKSIRKAYIKELRKLLEFCLNFEKENLALTLSIRGILVRSKDDVESKKYR